MRFFSIILLLFLTSCDNNHIEGAEYTVIQYERNGWPFDNAEPASLNREEIKEIEDIIRDKVQKHTKNFNNREPKDQNKKRDFVFYRQYVAAILPNGDKAVWINFICSINQNDKKKWKNKVVLMRDGGPCFFQVKVNLTKKTYYDYHVNGIAVL